MSNNDSQVTKVAVIIPCYNHSKYVIKAINSVATQDYEHKCIYVSNEGSSDDSKEKILGVISEKKQVDKYTVFGYHQNGKTPIVFFDNPSPSGPSNARNTLIQIGSKNDVYMMLDADDYYLPNKIKESVSVFEKDKERIGIVYTDAVIYNEKLNTKIHEYREPFTISRLREECIISNTPLISKKALAECGGYDTEMRTAEDWDLWLRITKKFVAIHIPKALHVYRVTGNNSSDTVSKEIWQKNWALIAERMNGGRY